MKTTTQTIESIKRELEHCTKMCDALKDTDKIDLFHRFVERKSELELWIKNNN